MSKHRVVIIGSGFGGLFAAKSLKKADVDVTLIARTTSHLFQPLLYQVATGVLAAGDVAPPTREILRRQKNARVLLGLVEDIDMTNKVVKWRFHNDYQETPYDSLIVAAGAGQSYFGNDHFATFAPGMKTIDDALELRSRILKAFELAEFATEEERKRLLTFVIVGAGPTGVEMAGQIRELAVRTLKDSFRSYDPASARVILLDGANQVLPPFGQELGKKTQQVLEKMGVEVQLGSIVTDLDADSVTVRRADGSTDVIASECKVWAAGVQGSELGAIIAEQSGAELDRAGRVVVADDLTLPGHPEVFVLGDMAAMPGNVPGVAQGAIQGAKYAAKTIIARLTHGEIPGPFKYFDKGSMATIARFSAVTKVGKVKLTGFIAWVAWLFLHLLYIAGFKQQVTTLLMWCMTFITNGRSQMAVTNQMMVGRLALEKLGTGVSGKLFNGEEVDGPTED